VPAIRPRESSGLGASSYDLQALSYGQLVSELEEIKRWLRNQSASTPDVLRLEQVRDELLAEIDRRDSQAKSGTEKGARTPSVPKPRVLTEKSSVMFRDEDEMRREVSHMEAWLERGGLGGPDRATVRSELNAVQPLAATIDHFTFDGWHVPDGQKAKLEPLAKQIAAAPRVPVRVVGHTDPVGTHAYNVDLGRRRANEVVRFLKAALKDVAPGRGVYRIRCVQPRRNGAHRDQ
jgi:outer membrane protein OmpA-like peptidoglycan-associated protein